MSQTSHARRFRPIDLIFLTVVLLLFPTACVCWPSLPALIHQDGCGWPQYAAAGSGNKAVPLPPKTFIAYARHGDVWIMDSDGKNKKRLTSDPGREFSLSASPQKEQIWFVRAAAGTGGNGDFGNVYACDYDGKHQRQVTAGLKVKFAAVSPNGKSLAIAVLSDLPGTFGQTADMWLVDAQATMLTASSPHINLTGDLGPSVAGGRDGSTYAAWSQATGQIAFTFKPDSSASLGISTSSVYVANADGTGRVLLAASAGQPSFNGFGTSVALTTGAHWDTMGIARVSTDGGLPTDVVQISSGAPLYRTYSPIFITTYEEAREWPTVVYAKTMHPAAPAQAVNTLEKYRIDGGKTTVLVTQTGAENVITNVVTDNMYKALYFQTGTATLNNTAIWSVKPDGTGLVTLSAGDGDSEPTAAVSYSWYNKSKSGGTNYYANCHWPYEK